MEDNRRATLPSSISNDPSSTQSSTRVCMFFNRPSGCMYGNRCRYVHATNVESRGAGSKEMPQDSFHNARSNLDQPPNRQSTQDPKRRQQRSPPRNSNNRGQKAEKQSVKSRGGGRGRAIENKVSRHADSTHFEPVASHESPSPSPLTQLSPSHGDECKEHTGRDDHLEDVSHLHSLLQFPQIGSESASHYHHYHQQHRYHQHYLPHAHQHQHPHHQQHPHQQQYHQYPHPQHHKQHPHHQKTHQQHPHQKHQHQKQQPRHQQQYTELTTSRPDAVTSGYSTAEHDQATTGSRSFSNRGRGQARRGPTSEFSLGDLLVRSTTSNTRQPVARPPTAQSANLFATEMQQLELRFRDNLQISEKSSRQHVYKIQFEPTDPEWPFSFKTLPLKSTFPCSYPRDSCTIVLVGGEENPLPQYCSRCVNEAIGEELKRLCQSLGRDSLIFRPFLKWLDRNILELIRMSCSPKDLDSLLQIHKALANKMSPDDPHEDCNSEDQSNDNEGCVYNNVPDNNEVQFVSMIDTGVKRGTEVKIKNLTLSSEVGVIQCTQLKMTVLCGRCRETIDVQVQPNKHVLTTCRRCHLQNSVHYRPSTAHLESTTLGFLDVDNCIVYDIVIFGSEVIISCMSCAKNTSTKGLQYGQPHMLWCQQCHQKLVISIETCRLMQHAALENPTFDKTSTQPTALQTKKKKEMEIVEGKPLPERGTCQHYKKSHRWLRFPCCGKAFPCDVCHDTREDHPYELANRMICGFCAKEQPYTSGKPCITCKSSLTGTTSSGFWEGGQGCRNKAKMNRNEKRKYTNSASKTTSLKSERVGAKGKVKAVKA